MTVCLFLGAVPLVGCADITEDLNPANWGSDAAETEPVPGETEDFPNLSSVPEPPENVTSLEEIQQVEQSLVADSVNAQYTTSSAQRVSDETSIEPMPEPPPEVVEEVLDEEIVVEEEIDADGEVVDEVIIEEDVEIEVDEGAALEVVETEEVAAVDMQPSVDEVEVVEAEVVEVDVVEADVVAEPVAAETVVVEAEIDAPEPQIMSPVGSPDDALAPQRVTTRAIVEEQVPAAMGVSDVVVVEEDVAVVDMVAMPDAEGSMSQSFDALFAASGPDATAGAPTTTMTASGYQTLVAVIKFNDGSSALDTNDRQIIKDIAISHGRQGGGIRLAGYASRQAGVAEEADELLANFNISLDRATAVADELVRQGVASTSIVIDAQGDHAFANLASGQLDEADQRRVDVYFTN